MSKNADYSTIVNPTTNRKVNVNGKIGKRVLKNYIKQKGSATSVPLCSEKVRNEMDRCYKCTVQDQYGQRYDLTYYRDPFYGQEVSCDDSNLRCTGEVAIGPDGQDCLNY